MTMTIQSGGTLSSNMAHGSLVDLMAEQVAQRPHSPIYTFLRDGEADEQCMTSAELQTNVHSVAAALQQRVGAGERVVIALAPGLDYVNSFWACLHAGVCAVPLYPPMNPKHLERMLAVMSDCGASDILTASPLAMMMKAWLTANGGDPEQYRWICVDALPRDQASAWKRPSLGGSDVAFLQYTSGSTGEPKGVVLSHRALAYNSSLIADAYVEWFATAGAEAPDVSVSWLPPYHDLGLINGVLQPAITGKHAVLMSPLSFLEKPARWLRAISKYRAGISGGPCFGYDLCFRKVSEAEAEQLDLSSWLCAYNCAEPIRHDVVERFTKKFEPRGYRPQAFAPVYGMAEASLLVTVDSRWGSARWMDRPDQPGQSDAEKAIPLVSHGQARGDTRLLIVDPESRLPCAPHEIGEVWISGSSLADGYWGKPNLSAQAFQAYTRAAGDRASEGPFFRTGDLGYLTDDGTFFIAGRLKDLIIVRGKNYFPQDIETSALQSHRALRSGGGAAFAVSTPEGEGLVLVQELREELTADDATQVLGQVVEAISSSHGIVPADVVLIRKNALPKTSSGKVRRFKAREWYVQNELTEIASLARTKAQVSDSSSALRRKVERRMLSWIAEHADLDIQQIDREADISTFGVDSVSAIELVTELETLLPSKPPESAVAQFRSVASLAHFLATYEPPTPEAGMPGVSRADDEDEEFVLPRL